MDPRNPLARLDALAGSRSVRHLALSFQRKRGALVRRIDLVLTDGSHRSFELAEGASWIDLLDRLARALANREHGAAGAIARRSRRGPRRSGTSRR